MKIAVMAGTNVDTKMGADLLESKGFETISIAMADSCTDQTDMQYFSSEELEKRAGEEILKAKSQGAEKVFIYCNSLSASIDYKKISKETEMEIITPLETYANLPKSCRNIAVIAANGISAYEIDRIIRDSDSSRNVISMGNMSIVESIEEGLKPEEIIRGLNLKGMVKYFEEIEDVRYKIDTILLGCTHFPYIKDQLRSLTTLRVIDPGEDMIDRI
ncbi:aspartate/glutamate racemase family protein [Anaerosphaera multitolerans]|uniref:Racemase n=1 Tax=Anaerosphaera multitolerans TaxID=2487351 RepID=A0A437S984_9FIRM|nr:aspartate/glutamate racemase family protein [Anaerosphaera multitolerans]RVU55666.1 racemase [Anaerosphaera multitolerans]